MNDLDQPLSTSAMARIPRLMTRLRKWTERHSCPFMLQSQTTIPAKSLIDKNTFIAATKPSKTMKMPINEAPPQRSIFANTLHESRQAFDFQDVFIKLYTARYSEVTKNRHSVSKAHKSLGLPGIH